MIPIAALFASKGVKIILAVLAGLVIGWGAYIFLVKPHINPTPTTKQQADTIINHNYQTPKVYFGCMHTRIYERKEKDISNPDSVNTGSNPL